MKTLNLLTTLTLILIGIIMVRHFRFKSRKGAKIESGLWRIGISILACYLGTTLVLSLLPNLPELSLVAIKITGMALFLISLRSVPGTFAGQPDLLGRRSEISVSEGVTAVIPFIETLIIVSVASKDFQMGTSGTEDGGKKFIVTAHDSDVIDNTFKARLEPGQAAAYLKDVQGKNPTQTSGKERGYNNIAVVATVVFKTSDPKKYLLVDGENRTEKDKNVEKRLAKIVATRARHYSASVTDDFLVREKDLIAEKILQDMNPASSSNPTGGHDWSQVSLLGQEVIAINISFADFENQDIKNAQAQMKVEDAQKKAELKQANAVSEQVKAIAADLGLDLKDKSIVKLLLDVVQSERGKATRLVGDNAGSPAFFGQVKPTQPPTK